VIRYGMVVPLPLRYCGMWCTIIACVIITLATTISALYRFKFVPQMVYHSDPHILVHIAMSTLQVRCCAVAGHVTAIVPTSQVQPYQWSRPTLGCDTDLKQAGGRPHRSIPYLQLQDYVTSAAALHPIRQRARACFSATVFRLLVSKAISS
jgi:hypothetical protein